MGKTQFKLLGEHPENLDGGRMLGVGDTVDLSPTEEDLPSAARLIKNGTLVRVHHKAGETRNTRGEKE